MTEYISKIKDKNTGKIAYLKDAEARAQYQTIANEVDDLKNSSGVTDEQIDSAVTKYLTNNPVTGGLTSTAKNLLITILRNAVYDVDEQNKDEIKNMITELETSLASSTDTKSYNITNTLTNVTNSNSNTIIEEKTSYSATLTANNGYVISDVTITMSGVDITSSCYSNGVINISEVTGDIVITASATQVATVYSIEYILGNCVSSNTNESITENESYSATITPNEGYVLSTATITMNETDITPSAYNNGAINIEQVTGNVVITVNAIVEEKAPELVTDGLVDYFDFRNCTYNNSSTGDSTLISATQGNGGLYCWVNNSVTEQNEYGMSLSRGFYYSEKANDTTTKYITGEFTVMCKGYLQSNNHAFGTWVKYTNISPNVKVKGYYLNTSNETLGTSETEYATTDLPNGKGYRTITIWSDGQGTAKLYIGETLVATYTGTDYDNFSSWFVSGVGMTSSSMGQATALAVYNKALTEVQIVDNLEYLQTLEVA